MGAIAANGALGNKPSIPSRFETVLNTSVRESDAFGRRTYRFDDPENELPGPGSYRKNRNIVSQSATSVSKKGSAAFASAEKAGFTDDAPQFVTPGPGEYYSPSKRKPQPLSPPFCPPQPRLLLKVKVPAVGPPGPGSYVRHEPLQAPCPALCQKAIRDPYVLSDKTAPGPGEWQSEKTLSSFLPRDPLRASCFTRSTQGRFGGPQVDPQKRTKVMDHLPAPLSHQTEFTRATFSPTVEETVLSEKCRPTESTPDEELRRKTAAFADSNLDRFGKPIVRYSAEEERDVGPGSYELERKPRRLLISSSWALSSVARDIVKDKYQPPGPAYYAPQVLPSKTAHRVGNGSWS